MTSHVVEDKAIQIAVSRIPEHRGGAIFLLRLETLYLTLELYNHRKLLLVYNSIIWRCS